MKCRKCGGKTKLGKALQNTPSLGLPDFPGQKDLKGQTVSMTGPPKMYRVHKCQDCGHSFTGRGELL